MPPLPARLPLRALAAALLALGAGDALADTTVALPSVGAASGQASAVGVSSGGYMAIQLAVAWPERFVGLGVLAAGPWGCAQGSLSLALNQCMEVRRGAPSLDTLALRHERYQQAGEVGASAALGQLRAFVWHGQADDVVDPALGHALAEQLTAWLDSPEQLRVETRPATGHGWPMRLPDDYMADPQALGDCRQGGGSHLLACDDDVAGRLLDWLYPGRADVAESATEDVAEGAAESHAEAARLLAFDQREFGAPGLAEVGYVFVPKACEKGGCPVTLALHGCQMGADAIDDLFIRYSGLNRWAVAHDQIVLYPQADATLTNPQGCWDWWGFAESPWQANPLHDSREGVQVQALMAMLARLEAPLRDER